MIPLPPTICPFCGEPTPTLVATTGILVGLCGHLLPVPRTRPAPSPTTIPTQD